MPESTNSLQTTFTFAKTFLVLLLYKIVFVLIMSVLTFEVGAQDQIFLRSDEGMLDCYIIQMNDSMLIFRTLDPSDTTEYEILIRETYGYVLEDGSKQQSILTKEREYYLRCWHPDKKRKINFKEEKGIYFRLKTDTSLFARRGKIVQLATDTLWIEQKKKGKLERNPYLLADLEMLGYTTFWTELATLIIIPTSTVKEGSLQFYRSMHLNKGWNWKMEMVNNAIDEKKIKRRFRPGKSFKLPKSVKRKTKKAN